MQNILNGSQTFTSVCVVPTIIQNQSTWNISSTGLCSVACGVAHAPCWLEISGSDLAGGVFDLCRENTAYPQIAKVTLCCSSHETGVTYQYEEPKIKSTPGSWDGVCKGDERVKVPGIWNWRLNSGVLLSDKQREVQPVGHPEYTKFKYLWSLVH